MRTVRLRLGLAELRDDGRFRHQLFTQAARSSSLAGAVGHRLVSGFVYDVSSGTINQVVPPHMRAVVVSRPGGPEVLELVERPVPSDSTAPNSSPARGILVPRYRSPESSASSAWARWSPHPAPISIRAKPSRL